MRGLRYERSTIGFDSTLTGVGSDLTCLPYNTGIRIPPRIAPPMGTVLPACQQRFVYMLARASFQAGQKARLVGMRQLLNIGVDVSDEAEDSCSYPLELTVTSPTWRFVDGMVSWHLRRINAVAPIVGQNTTGANNALTSTGQDAQSAGLLGTQIGAFVGDSAASYTPLLQIPGESFNEELGSFYGIRFPWIGQQSYFSMDYEIEGPVDIALYATVRQTDPETRCVLNLPAAPVFGSQPFLPIEEAFVNVFPTATYKRIAGSLIFEEAGSHPC